MVVRLRALLISCYGDEQKQAQKVKNPCSRTVCMMLSILGPPQAQEQTKHLLNLLLGSHGKITNDG